MSDIDRQFRQARTRVTAQARQQRESITSQARQRREEVEEMAGEAKEKLRGRRSELERQVQVAKGGIRREAAQERRKRDLPITKPLDVKEKERIADVETQEKEIKGEIKEAEKGVEEARQKDVEAITTAEVEAKAEVTKQETEALATLAQEETQFKAENIQLDTGDYVNREEFNQLPQATQQKLNELGVEGYNSWLGQQQLALKDYETDGGYDLAGFLHDKPNADTNNLLAIGFTQADIDSAVTQNKKIAEFESELKSSNPALYEVYQDGGLEAYNTAVERLQGITDRYNVTVNPSGEHPEVLTGVTLEQLKAGETAPEIISEPITYFDLGRAIKSGVSEGDLVLLGFTQADIKNAQQAGAVFAQLEPYKSGYTQAEWAKLSVTEKAKSIPGATYDLPRFLRNNPSFDTKLLVTAGFTQKAVDAAVEYNKQPWVQSSVTDQFYEEAQNAGFAPLSLHEVLTHYDATRGYTVASSFPVNDETVKQWLNYEKQYPAEASKIRMLNVVMSATSDTPQEATLSLQAFRDAYVEARGYKTEQEKEDLERLASLEYHRLYGGGTTFASTMVGGASYLFSPIRVLYPEVELKDISGLEWAVGGAQIALLAIPIVGLSSSIAARAIITGVEIAAGTTFAVATGVQWADMSWFERGISLAMTAAIFAPAVVKTGKWYRRQYLKYDPSVVAKAETTLSKAWKNLDSVELKFGRESPQYIKALRTVESAQVDLRAAIGEVAQSAGKSVKTAIRLAKDAGQATRNMDRALSNLERLMAKGSSGSKIAKASSAAQRAIELSRQADQRLINQFGRLESLTVEQLSQLERQSGIRGLKRAVLDVNKAQARLNKLWQASDTVKARYGPTSPQYIKAMNNIAKAQGSLESAFESFGGKLRVRAGVSQARGVAGWDALIKQTEGDITQIQAELERLKSLLRKPKMYRESDMSAKTLKRYINELEGHLKYSKLRLSEYISSRDAKVPIEMTSTEMVVGGRRIRRIAPAKRQKPVTPTERLRSQRGGRRGGGRGKRQVTTLTEVKIKPPDPNLQKLLDDIALKVPPEGKGGVAVATRVKAPTEVEVITRTRKTRVVKTKAGRPVPKRRAYKPKAKPEPVEKQLSMFETEAKPKAPKVKVEPEYDPRYREREAERLKPDPRDFEDAIIEAIGVSIGESPLVREEISPITKTVIESNPDVIRATQRILAQAIKRADKLENQGKTSAQIRADILTYVRNLTNALTNPATKVALKPQLKPLTDVATKVATKVQVKTPPKTKTKTKTTTRPPIETRARVRIRPRTRIPRIPITVTLPDGSQHTLTPEELAGAVGYKQGFIFRAIWPPYGQNNVTHSRKPILGIPYYKGPESAYRSIVRRGGKLPPTIARDVGIMDVYITTGKYGKPKLTFKPDVKQKTRVTGTHGKTEKAKPVPTLSRGR